VFTLTPRQYPASIRLTVSLILLVLSAATVLAPAVAGEMQKRRIFIVSSYDRSYLWSHSTHAGVVAAMLRYGYLDDAAQGDVFFETDRLETSRVVLSKSWMDTKRKNSSTEMAEATMRIMGEIESFQPDLVLLGDDNAANFIGNQLLDTDIPVVFWGINGLPLKYGLIDSMDRPGHNITGIWQAGYYRECMDLLHLLVPKAETFAILSCDSVTARPKIKEIQALARRDKLPLKLVETVKTNSLPQFKRRALELAEQVDAFFVLNHDTMRDAEGRHVDMLEVGRWYLENIHKPEAANEDQFVHEGMLLTANDSGYNQSYMAFEMAYDILEQGLNPGLIRTKTPAPGPLMVNRRRAEMLGIDLEPHQELIDEIIDEAIALQP